MTTELACLKYTKEDWIRVYHENLLWAEEQLTEAESLEDRLAWTYYIAVHNKWLKENDLNHPWSLSQYIKSLAYQVVQAQRQMLHMEHKLNELSQHKHKYKQYD